MDCLFCKISKGDIPAIVVHRDDTVVAFEDIHPQAKHHIVIIPIKHIATLNEVEDKDKNLIGHLLMTASKLAKQLNIAEDGYRIVMNCNTQGGQTVFHIHVHLLGGRQMHWPPG